jgi:hypothetical protein
MWGQAACLVLSLGALLTFERIGSHLFVVALEGSQILTRLGELAFLHALTDVPMDESTLGVHEIELVRECGPGLGDGGGVGKHAAAVMLVS